MQKLLQQESGSQPRMDHPEKMKTHAVPATKINWQRGGSGTPNQTHGRVVPNGVSDLRMRELPRRDLARRKDGQHSALLQPAQCFPHGAPVDVKGVSVNRAISLNRAILKRAILK